MTFGPTQRGAKTFGGSRRLCLSDSVQSQFDGLLQCVNMKLAAEIIMQLLLIGFSVNMAFIDGKSLNTRTFSVRVLRTAADSVILTTVSEAAVDANAPCFWLWITFIY